MPKLSDTLVIAFSFACLTVLGMFYIDTKGREQIEILAHTIPAERYTLQHAALDMEGIHNRLVQSTETLQEIAQSFSTLVERLEDKKSQQVTANN